jgi:PKD repeat protein
MMMLPRSLDSVKRAKGPRRVAIEWLEPRQLLTSGVLAANAGAATADVSMPGIAVQPINSTDITGDGGEQVALASFTTSPTTYAVSGKLTATINWGDGSSPTAGIFEGGVFMEYLPGQTMSQTNYVYGQHAYAQAGAYTVTVTISGTGGLSATTNSTVIAAPIQALGISFDTTTNQALADQTLTSFSVANTNASASDFTATINWGDGATTAGTVSLANPMFRLYPSNSVVVLTAESPLPNEFVGKFIVSGDHTYATAGTYTVQVTIVDGADAVTTTSAAVATVTNDSISAYPRPVSTAAGETAVTIPDIANFFESGGLPASDFTVTINWGDGSNPSVGTVQATPIGQVIGGPVPEAYYAVYGQHQYAAPGTYVIQLTITDTLGGSATLATTANVTAGMNFIEPGVFNTPVAPTSGTAPTSASAPISTLVANVGTPHPGKKTTGHHRPKAHRTTVVVHNTDDAGKSPHSGDAARHPSLFRRG